MKRKPLFITLIVALAVIGIVAVVLFMKSTPAEPVKAKQHKLIAEPEPAEPEDVEIIDNNG